MTYVILLCITQGVVKTRTSLLVTFLVILTSALIIQGVFVERGAESNLQNASVPQWFVVEGLVENRLNITYAELQNYPMVSEFTVLQCVGSGQGGIKVTYNWTGVPLFHILNRAKVIPGSYRKVVFNATDGFSSSIMLQTAMEPTTLLGLEVNGTDLEHVYGLANGHRVVLPCRWGYKWVKWIRQIIIVDYDYKGTYESNGLSDEALRPNCTMPITNPPIRNFTAFAHSRVSTVRALTNSSIESFNFEPDKRLVFQVAGTGGTSGYFYLIFQRGLLASPYQVFVNQDLVQVAQTDTSDSIHLYFSYSHSNHTITIEGASISLNSGGGGLRQKLSMT
jgi:hypothetical protein